MTKQHPLEMITDGMTDDMRRAYDLGLKKGRDEQLEQCIAWFDDTDCLAQRMRKAMRPQEDK